MAQPAQADRRAEASQFVGQVFARRGKVADAGDRTGVPRPRSAAF